MHDTIFSAPQTIEPITEAPCARSPCGRNAECIPKGSYADCRCLPDYYGNPYEECKPECTINSDCPFYLACIRNKCIDPCPGSCGINAQCQVVVHKSVCTCQRAFTGDPYKACSRIPRKFCGRSCLDFIFVLLGRSKEFPLKFFQYLFYLNLGLVVFKIVSKFLFSYSGVF